MSAIPSHWAKVAISEVAQIISGGTPPSKDEQCFSPPGQGIPWLTPADLSGYKKQVISHGSRDLSSFGISSCSAKVMPTGAVLFSSRAPIGYVVIASNPISTNQGFKSFVFAIDFDSRFSYYQLKHIKPVAEAMATGTTFKELSGSAAAKLPFLVAPLNEQKRIADKLDTVLTRVDAVNARLARVAPLLKRFRQSVLAAAMSGRLTEDWRGAHPTVPLTKELLLESRLGHNPTSRDTKITHGLVESGLHVGAGQDLPENWLRSCIGMIGVVSNGSTPSRARPDFWIGPIHWVSSGEVRNRKIRSTNESITQLGFESSSVRLLPAGTVLIAMIGEGKTRGQSALLEIEATINQNIAAIVPVPELIESQYLWYWFQSQYETNRLAGNGSGPQALNCQKVRELPINLPPMEEQSEIIRRVETLFAFADRLEARLQAARTAANRLTPALLAKAFRGELVPQDPNDEPAAELLKRLAASAPATTKRRGRPAKAA